ncbi:MAG TPA: sarcosine oxidase subunit gamma SoxG [Desulfobacteraceae bacterium]|nr:sarcosine oxidase subunit gamma SoxG [Deltaproteobacteria bacterium]MBW2356183.1 sarcosine oxidase subunit gamma SoxG [Deltaproteobacteria bacterium]HDI59072.1 sarcosine oxidase subunit gamma SoxG [Desulfobacteraceae bacterium]
MKPDNRLRQSPVQLDGRPHRTLVRDHWPVVCEYADEGDGPWLVDLSHCQRIDIQARPLAAMIPEGLPEPEAPGEVRIQDQSLITRMGKAQACLWRFGQAAAFPVGFNGTEITEATLALAILGRHTFAIAEKLSSLDLQAPGRSLPRLYQGPFAQVPCQLVVLDAAAGREMLLLSCSRGYGRDMVGAITNAGAEFNLRPAGEDRFMRMFENREKGA